MDNPTDADSALRRIRDRLGAMAGTGMAEVLGSPGASPAPETTVFCVLGPSAPCPPEGFELVATFDHKEPLTVGRVIRDLAEKSALPFRHSVARLCRKLGIADVVGSRIIYRRHPVLREFYFAKPGAAGLPKPGVHDPVFALLVTVLGMGRLPVVGATAASAATCIAAGILFALLAQDSATTVLWVFAIACTLVCAALEHWSQKTYFAEDPREVVLDEVAGMAIALAISGASTSITGLLVAFFAFRFFDIFKFGVHWIEETSWPGTIAWDDALAGIYAGLVTLGILWLL